MHQPNIKAFLIDPSKKGEEFAVRLAGVQYPIDIVHALRSLRISGTEPAGELFTEDYSVSIKLFADKDSFDYALSNHCFRFAGDIHFGRALMVFSTDNPDDLLEEHDEDEVLALIHMPGERIPSTEHDCHCFFSVE